MALFCTHMQRGAPPQVCGVQLGPQTQQILGNEVLIGCHTQLEGTLSKQTTAKVKCWKRNRLQLETGASHHLSQNITLTSQALQYVIHWNRRIYVKLDR